MIKRTLKIGLIAFAFAGMLLASLPVAASAVPLVGGSAVQTFAAAAGPEGERKAVNCPDGGSHPQNYDGEQDVRTCCPASAGNNPTTMECFFAKYIQPAVDLLAVGAGVMTVGSVIAGGIQIGSAGADTGKFSKGRERIINSLLALGGLVFLYAFLQWIIPGGVF